MYIIKKNETNLLLIYNRLLDASLEEWAIKFHKPDANITKIVIPSDIEINPSYIIFAVCETEEDLENLNAGLVNLLDGQWLMTILTKNILQTEYTEAYLDVLRVLTDEEKIRLQK